MEVWETHKPYLYRCVWFSLSWGTQRGCLWASMLISTVGQLQWISFAMSPYVTPAWVLVSVMNHSKNIWMPDFMGSMPVAEAAVWISLWWRNIWAKMRDDAGFGETSTSNPAFQVQVHGFKQAQGESFHPSIFAVVKKKQRSYGTTVDGSEIRCSPVEVGSLSTMICKVQKTSQLVIARFLNHQTVWVLKNQTILFQMNQHGPYLADTSVTMLATATRQLGFHQTCMGGDVNPQWKVKI